nr:hypothetical protein [Butyrivibrio sp.]
STEEVLLQDVVVANLNKKEDNVSSVDGENYTTYENTTFTAKFLPTYDVTYEAALVEYDGAMVTGGSVTSDKDENIRSDGTVNINGSTAETQNIGFRFVGWYNGETEVTTEETLTADLMKDYLNKNAEDSNLYADTTFTAKFAVNEDETYDVRYVVANDPEDPAKGHGVVNPKITENIQVLGTKGVTGSVATPDKGYRFVAWYKLEIDASETTRGIAVNRVPVDFTIDEDGNGILSEETAVKYVNTDGEIFYNTTFEAEFAVDDDNVYDVFYIAEPGGKAEPTENKGIQILSNAEVTGSVATPDEGYEFLGWYVEGKDEPITTDLTLTEENAQVNIKSSENPDSSAVEDTSEPTYITYETTKFYARFAAKIYNVTYEYRIAGDVEKPANWDALVAELATHNTQMAYGNPINCPDLPVVDGYTFSIWSMEEVKKESLSAKVLGTIGGAFKALTGAFTSHAASQVFTMPASDVVIYSIVTKDAQQTEVPDYQDRPLSTGEYYDEPQANNGGDNPAVAGVNRPAEESAVLGEKREAEEEAVLGARRGGTDDTTDSSRVFVLLLAAGAMATLLAAKKRRYEK